MRNLQRSTVRIRSPRSAWRDPRFIIGLLLIVLSIAAVTTLVSNAKQGTQLYYATTDIPAGEALTETNTAIIEARPGNDVYLKADEGIDGRNTVHSLRAGELIPRSAAGTAHDNNMRTFVVTVDDGLPEDTTQGAELELWFIPRVSIGDDNTQPPQKVAQTVYLVKIIGNTGGIGSSAGTRIEIRSNAEGMEQILAFSHGNGTLAAVPVGQK